MWTYTLTQHAKPTSFLLLFPASLEISSRCHYKMASPKWGGLANYTMAAMGDRDQTQNGVRVQVKYPAVMEATVSEGFCLETQRRYFLGSFEPLPSPIRLRKDWIFTLKFTLLC